MNEPLLTVEQNWRLLIESIAEAKHSAKESPELSGESRVEMLARLDSVETALRALESCWRPIRKLVAVAPAPVRDVPQTTPQRDYLLPLLKVLAAQAGRLRAREAVAATKALMADRLMPKDFEPTESGRIRYDSNVRFAREALKQLGLIKPASDDGHWELSEAGRRAEATGVIPVTPVAVPDPRQMDMFG